MGMLDYTYGIFLAMAKDWEQIIVDHGWCYVRLKSESEMKKGDNDRAEWCSYVPWYVIHMLVVSEVKLC